MQKCQLEELQKKSLGRIFFHPCHLKEKWNVGLMSTQRKLSTRSNVNSMKMSPCYRQCNLISSLQTVRLICRIEMAVKMLAYIWLLTFKVPFIFVLQVGHDFFLKYSAHVTQTFAWPQGTKAAPFGRLRHISQSLCKFDSLSSCYITCLAANLNSLSWQWQKI